ncbi:MAG: ABC transporter permease, partial [Verrucomicrobiota bacterium]|nr:ABC transporter permease [Verrucomicrobiota bacterium]
LALWGTQALLALVPKEIPRAASIQLDVSVLFFTLAISVVTGIIFGLAPALQATSLDFNSALKASARGLRSSARGTRFGRALVVSEIALAVVVLVGAGLLLQSFKRLGEAKSGMQTDQLLTARITLPDVAYPRPEMIVGFYDRLIARLRSMPGVRVASTTFPLPLSGSVSTTSFDRAEHPFPVNELPNEVTQLVGSDYFPAMGIPLLRGRRFADSDRLGSKPVVIVNERFAEKYFPGEDAVGQHIKPSWAMGNEPPQMREIIGVTGNAKHLALKDDFVPEMYVPIAQIGYPTSTILLRTENSNPAAMANVLRQALAQTDPSVPLTAVRTFADYRSRSLGTARFNALLLSIFAGIALALAAIGVYGVTAYSVAQRTGEIGVRMALGAQRSAILRLILGEGIRIVALSLVLGCAGAFVCARFLRGLLYEIAPWDSATFAAIALLLALIALLACWLPARRASQLNPLEALRSE